MVELEVHAVLQTLTRLIWCVSLSRQKLAGFTYIFSEGLQNASMR